MRMSRTSSIPKRAGKGEEYKDDQSWIPPKKGLGVIGVGSIPEKTGE